VWTVRFQRDVQENTKSRAAGDSRHPSGQKINTTQESYPIFSFSTWFFLEYFYVFFLPEQYFSVEIDAALVVFPTLQST